MERILLVEDDGTIVAALKQFLLSEGFSVQTASGQTEALAAIEAAEFDLVLLDVGLKDGNGFSVCSAVKQRTKSAVIFLSASGDEYSVVTGLDLGTEGGQAGGGCFDVLGQLRTGEVGRCICQRCADQEPVRLGFGGDGGDRASEGVRNYDLIHDASPTQ